MVMWTVFFLISFVIYSLFGAEAWWLKCILVVVSAILAACRLSGFQTSALSKNWKNAEEANDVLIESLKRRGLNSSGGWHADFDPIKIIKNPAVIILFATLGGMAVAGSIFDGEIGDKNSIKYFLHQLFEFSMFFFATLGVALNFLGRVK